MEARMRRDFEAVDRSEAAEAMAKAMAEAREWERIEAEAEAGRDKYRGVRKVPSGKYVAEIRDPNTGKQVWLGTYSAALVAACAYDIAARSLQRDKAKPNFAYPPPPKLVSAVAAAPRRRGHSIPAPPEPPSPAPFVDYFSIQAPATAPAPSEPAPCPVCPLRHVGRTGTARARIVLPVPALKKEPEITMMRSISPETFAIQAAEAAYRRLADRVGLFTPLLHTVAPAFSSAETCFSYTVDPAQRDSASSSATRRRLMLKKPKVLAVPTTATTSTPSTNEDFECTGDNFTGVPVPWFFTLPPAARMPFDIDRAL